MDNGNEIKVSVLVPVYNVEQWLPRCLDSILGQTLRDIEVVCVDDASPDNSAAILADYAARDPRVRIITKTANEGLMMARKTGYTNARGQYFFFCDSDDYLPPDALESLYHAAKTENLDIAVGERYLETLDNILALRFAVFAQAIRDAHLQNTYAPVVLRRPVAAYPAACNRTPNDRHSHSKNIFLLPQQCFNNP